MVPLVVLLLSAAARAEDLPAVSLPAVLAEAAEANPEIAAARAQAGAATGRIWSAASPANVMVEGDRETEVTGMRNTGLTLRLDLPFPGRTYFSGRAASSVASAARARAIAKGLEIRQRVTIAYAALAREDLTLDAIRSTRDLMRQAAVIAQARVSGNQAGNEDLLLAQAEAARADVMLTMELNERALVESDLAALLRRPAGRSRFGPATPLPIHDAPWSATELVDRARDRSPRIRAAALEAAAAGSEAVAADLGVLPSLSPFLTRKTYDGGGTGTMAGLGLSYPLFFWGPALEATAARRSAAAARAMAQGEEADVIRVIEAELSEVRSHGSAARDEGGIVVPLLDQAVQAAQASYASGKGDILKLLEAARAELAARQEAANQTAHAAEHWARLETAVGAPLEENIP